MQPQQRIDRERRTVPGELVLGNPEPAVILYRQRNQRKAMVAGRPRVHLPVRRHV